MGVDRQVDRAEKSLQRQLDWIRAIDTKTQIVLGLNMAVLGSLIAVSPDTDHFGPRSAILLAIGGVCPGLSIAQCIRAFFPQTKGPGDSRVFFGAIVKRGVKDFVDVCRSEADETYLSDILEQVYRNAEIANQKYKFVKSAILLQAVGIPFWLVGTYLLFRG